MIRIILLMCGLTMSDSVRKEIIWEKVGVELVKDKIWEVKLRWFGHVIRRCVDA